MWKHKFTVFYLFLTFLYAGCDQPRRPAVTPSIDRGIKDVLPDSIPEETGTSTTKTPLILESHGDLTLGQALALVLIHNPELKTYSLETRAAEARTLQAGLRPNPEFEVEIENIGGTGQQRGFKAAESTFQLSQLIELGDKAGKRRKAAAFEKELADLDFQSKRLDLFSETAKAFISVLKAQEELQLSNELLKLSEESFAAVEKRADAGKDSPIEKTRASVALSTMKITHLETQRNLDYTKKHLASFWGQDTPLFERAAGNLDRIEPLPSPDELKNLLKQNPQYARWDTEIQKSRAVLELEKSKAIGDITVGAGVRRFNETRDNAFVLGISIPLPLSDRNQGARQEAVYNLAKSTQEQKAAWLKLQTEFNQAYQDYANAYHRADSLKNTVLPAAHEMFGAAIRAYQEGKADYLNVLDAQRTYFEVKSEYIQHLSAYHIAKMDIERFVGNLAETATISESEE